MRVFKKFLHPQHRVNEKDLFFGLHIHKTAGMTLLGQIKSQLRRDQYYINSMYAVNFKENTKELEERLPDGIKSIRVVFGHGVHQYMLTFFKDRNIKLFTFLREPVHRIVSLYCFNKKLLGQFGGNAPDFNEFYNRFFPRLSQCLMITQAFPAFIDSRDDPLYLQAISVLSKFYFIATIDDFSNKTPDLFEEIGISFSAEKRINTTNYKRAIDSEDQIDYDFLRQDNRDDIKLYEAVQDMCQTGELNYFGFDASGYDRSIKKVFSWNTNPYATLLRTYHGPIKRNYKLEKIYNDALAKYEKELAMLLVSENVQERELTNVLIKLYALEEIEAKRKYYKELLTEINNESDLGLARLLQ